MNKAIAEDFERSAEAQTDSEQQATAALTSSQLQPIEAIALACAPRTGRVAAPVLKRSQHKNRRHSVDDQGDSVIGTSMSTSLTYPQDHTDAIATPEHTRHTLPKANVQTINTAKADVQ